MSVVPARPEGVRTLTEERGDSGLYVHPEWVLELPWLVQGITGSDADMSLFAGSPGDAVLGRWTALRDAVGCRVMIHARQVHGSVVHVHDAVPDGVLITPDADGHLTRTPAVLLGVTVADCVPISILAPMAGVIAALHGGWRGVAAGILERGLELVRLEAAGSLDTHEVDDIRVHLGPAICGECYEVGPEVPAALGLPEVSDVVHLDVRSVLASRAIAAGIPAEHVTISTFCTRHGDSPFYSHRGGCRERQMSVLGIRAH